MYRAGSILEAISAGYRRQNQNNEAYFREDAEVFEKNPVPFQAFHRFSLSYGPDEPIYEYEKKEKGRPRSMSRRLGELAAQGLFASRISRS